MTTDVYLFLAPLSAPANYYREAHPFGPDGGGGFNTDLAIEVDPAQIEPFARALAVTDGLIRFIPGTAGTGILVLKPSPLALADIGTTLGSSGSLVFVYRNVETTSVKTFATVNLLASGGIRPPATAQDLTAQFITGAFSLSVSAGENVGKASTAGGASGWARLGFEIVYTSAPFDEGWARLPSRIDQMSLTRRLDPLAFYTAAASASTGAKLTTAHAGHVLLGLPTRRTLIEIRDEYDEPFPGAVSIQKGAAAVVTAPAVAGSRSTFVVETLPPIGPAPSTTYTVSIADHVLTLLPSGPSAAASTAQTILAPTHWTLQAIFMSPSPAPADESKSWFVSNTKLSSPDALPRFTAGNKVTPLIDGLATLKEFVAAIRTAKAKGHFVYLAAWSLRDGFELDAGDLKSTTLLRLVKDATAADADVRALVWDDSVFGGNFPFGGNLNTGPVNRINALPGGGASAILDAQLPSLWSSHHQKFLIVNGANGATAYCGGVDIDTNRRDSSRHGAIGGFHDVHAKVEGPAVTDIHRTFVDRWNDHPTTTVPNQLETSAPAFKANAGSEFVQVARTYSGRHARGGTALGHYRTFAPDGSRTPLDAWIRAIERARKFIYVEDQYLTPYAGDKPLTGAGDTLGVLTALRAALSRIDYLLIVIANHADLPQNRFRRQQFIEGLRSVPGSAGKVHVFFLGRDESRPGAGELATEGGCPTCSGGPTQRREIYCHSKVWIVDDICAKIGSSNQNRRSFTNDSEMDVIVVDGAVDDGVRTFARRLRKSLWSEHLNLSPSRSAQLDDHRTALSLWLNPPTGARVRPYQHNDQIESTLFPPWESVDPDGS